MSKYRLSCQSTAVLGSSREYPISGSPESLDPLSRSIPEHQIIPVVLGLSRDYQTPWQSCVRVSQHAAVTLAVPGLSRNYQLPWHPRIRLSQNTGVSPAVVGLSQDYQLPGTRVSWYPRAPPDPSQPCIRVSQSGKVTLPVPGLSRDYQTPWEPCVRVS